MTANPHTGGRHKVVLLVVLVGLGCLVTGGALGLLGGRATAPTVAGQVDTSRAHGEAVIEALQRLPIEYVKTRLGVDGRTDATFAALLDVVRHKLDAAIDEAPWFGSRTITELQVSVDRLRADARSHVDPARFSTDTDRAIDVISKAYGVTVTPLATP